MVPRTAGSRAPSGSAIAAVKLETQPPSSKSTSNLRYDGKQELDGVEKVLSLGLTGGAFAALAVWAYKKNRKEDELETVRIKEEVERLEKLRAEFENVDEDDDALDDDEFMAELNKRIAKDSTDDDDESAPDSKPGDEKAANTETDPQASGPGTATLDRPDAATDEKQDAGDSRAPSQSEEDIDRLRRMWAAESPDDDKRKPKE